ncbi:radical SAM protein [Alicyclobacillus cellulosilyticus]|uniref:Radical SAM protein n=1 Tax=Alicyclobacillus cellulosilyticus TaxID=1003997 RepID=A0A917NND8_9BACL|nr:radical SAM protein [Alicyclobacillus cellulosilyticus]GGJ13566.1 radical SAM protein [Alicyclobacillus cellulosilyticus]
MLIREHMFGSGGMRVAAPRYEPLPAKEVLHRVQVPDMPFRWSINPYRGCTHGCSFCYARATHAYLGETPDDAFQTRIFVKEDAPFVLRAQLSRMLARHGGNRARLAAALGVVALGTATDPYQPAEARLRITRACLEVLAEFGVHVSITTRSPMILRDLDLLAGMRVRAVHISLHTMDRTVWRQFEPATPAPEHRLAALAKLVERGIRAGLFLAPILPFITDDAATAAEVAQRARTAGARFVVPSFLRLTPDVKRWFFGVLSHHYPHLLPRYEAIYRYGASASHAYTERAHARVVRVLRQHGFAPPTCASEADVAAAGEDRRITRAVRDEGEAVQLTLPI